jgi:hypothetical protein
LLLRLLLTLNYFYEAFFIIQQQQLFAAMEINPLAHISEQREPHENIQVDV